MRAGVTQIDRVVEAVEETLKGNVVHMLAKKKLPRLDLPKVPSLGPLISNRLHLSQTALMIACIAMLLRLAAMQGASRA